MDLRKLVDRLSRAAEQKFAKHGMIPPTWFAMTADGRNFSINKMLADKDLQAQFLRTIFENEDVVAYVFIDEAWVVHADVQTADAVTTLAAMVGLEHHPDRREVVVIHAEDDVNNLSFEREIIRPARGRPYLGPLTSYGVNKSEGRFVGLLPRRGTLQ
jgi:hypothetical protein